MDIIDNIKKDWQSSIAIIENNNSLFNTKNESIMNTFIAFEIKEKQAKETLKKLGIGLSLFLSSILLIYVLMNIFNATTVSYDIELMIVGAILMVLSLSFSYFLLKINRYRNIENLSIKDYLINLKDKFADRNKRSVISLLNLVFIYPLGLAMMCHGIFHDWFVYFLIGFMLIMTIVALYSWRKEHKEQTELYSEIDSMLNEF